MYDNSWSLLCKWLILLDFENFKSKTYYHEMAKVSTPEVGVSKQELTM